MPFRGSLQDIRLFVAAYEERSFTAAAARESSTQSGVSHHIRQLEDLLEVKLFVRDKAGVVSTPAADVYYRHCVELLRSIDQATQRLGEFTGGHQGSFVVGLIPALTHRIGAPALLRFAALHPNVKVRIVESFSSSMSDIVASGAIDFAVSTLHGGETGVQGRSLLTVPECVVSRADSPDPPEDVGTRPFNMVWASGMPRRRSAITASLAANGIRIDGQLEIDSGLAMLDLVGRSDWKTVSPAFMIDPVADGGRFRLWPLRGPAVPFTIMLIERTRTVLPPEAQVFVDILVEEAARAARHWVDPADVVL